MMSNSDAQGHCLIPLPHPMFTSLLNSTKQAKQAKQVGHLLLSAATTQGYLIQKNGIDPT